ncbi:potassium transporter KtrA, partial [Mycoplasmopsis pullorum]
NFVVGTTIIKNVELDGKMIRELALNNKGVTIILIKRNEKSMRAQGDTKIFLDDLVSLVGKVEDVTNVLGLFNEC